MILVFGSINADLIFRLDDLPGAGQTLLARELTTQPGGKGANQAVAAAKDGAEVRMVGAVGDDALAEVALAGLHAAGVDMRGVRRSPGTPTGCAAICTDSAGNNQIAVALGANAHVVADQVEDAELGPGTTLVLQMEGDPAEIAGMIHRAHAAGCRIVLNLAPAIPMDRGVLALVDLLIVNEDEAATLGTALGCGHAAEALHASLDIAVIRTMGSEGAELATPTGRLQVPAPSVTAIDTTAAGDCFVGVLAASLDRGANLAAAVTRACRAAALACTVAGSQSSLPDAADIDGTLAR